MRRGLPWLLLAAALGCSWLVLSPGDRPSSVDSLPPGEAAGDSVRCMGIADAGGQLDEVRRYRLRLRAVSWMNLLGGPAATEQTPAGRIDLDAVLSLSDHRVGDEVVRVARLGPQRRAEVEVFGVHLDPALFQGATATARLGDCGALGPPMFSRSSPEAARFVLQTILAELDVGPPAIGDQRPQMSMFGAGPVRYDVQIAAAGWSLSRTRRSYDRLSIVAGGAGGPTEGRWTAELDGDGRLKGLKGGERVDVQRSGVRVARGRSQVALTFEDAAPAALSVTSKAQLIALLAAPPRSPSPGPSARAQALAQRVDGLTAATLRADLLRYGNAGRMPDHERWLWQATGLLELRPEVAAELVGLYSEPALTDVARALVLDLLANVGHAEAQAALREALALPVSEASPRWGELVQRISLIQSPESETVDWLGERYAATDGAPQRHPVAYALGAAAGKRYRQGSRAEALTALAPLARDLAAATTDADHVALLDALGNVGAVEHLEAIERATTADAAEVRVAAATALRRVEDERARSRLLALAGDPVPAVQRAALVALGSGGLSADELRTLTAMVDDGTLGRDSLGAAVRLAARRADDPAGAGLLEAIRARGDVRPEVLAAARRHLPAR